MTAAHAAAIEDDDLPGLQNAMHLRGRFSAGEAKFICRFRWEAIALASIAQTKWAD